MFIRQITSKDRKNYTVAKLFELLKNMPQALKSLLHGVVILAKLMLVMPATNAESERIFSAMKRVKTYMRSTTSDDRLNHLMTLHVHKERLDELDLIRASNEFFLSNPDRRRIFGSFIDSDIPKKKTFCSQGTQC